MRSRMSLKFGKIQPWSGELTALERWKKIPIDLQCCERSSAIISDWIFFIFAGNKDSNKSSDEFEVQQNSTYLPLSILKMAVKCCDHSSTYMFYLKTIAA